MKKKLIPSPKWAWCQVVLDLVSIPVELYEERVSQDVL